MSHMEYYSMWSSSHCTPVTWWKTSSYMYSSKKPEAALLYICTNGLRLGHVCIFHTQHPHTRTHTHPHTCTHTHTHMHTRTHTHACTHTHAHTHAHPHPHTHTRLVSDTDLTLVEVTSSLEAKGGSLERPFITIIKHCTQVVNNNK